MQQVLRLLETRDYVQVAELAQDLCRFRGDGQERPDRAGAPGPRRPHPRRRPGAAAGPVRGRLRPAPAPRGREEARDRARCGGAWSTRARRSRWTRARPAYYLALELRAKRELVVVTNGLLVATALADAPGITVLVTGGMLRLSAMSLVGDLGADVLRTTRINKGFLGARGLSLVARPDGPQPGRGAHQAGDGRRVRAGVRHLRRHQVAPQRAALLRAGRGPARESITDSSAPADRGRGVAGRRRRGDHGRSRPARAAAAPAARPATGRRGTTSRSADGHAGRRRSRRTERARRRRAVRRRAARASPRSTASRTCRCGSGDTLHWDILGVYRDVLDGLRAAAREAGASTRSPSTRGASTSA